MCKFPTVINREWAENYLDTQAAVLDFVGAVAEANERKFDCRSLYTTIMACLGLFCFVGTCYC